MTVDKRWKIGSWWVVRRLIKLLMVIETRPVDPGSTQGSHRPISFIRKKYRTRADDICVKLSINNHIVGLVNRNHSYYTNASDVRRSLQSWVSNIHGCTHSWLFQLLRKLLLQSNNYTSIRSGENNRRQLALSSAIPQGKHNQPCMCMV